MNIQIYEHLPEDFHEPIEASACYIEIEGKLLLLQLGPGKSEEGFWGVPAGKREAQETPQQCAIRELFEETRIRIEPFQLKNLGTLYFRRLSINVIYHMFKIHVDKMPKVYLSNEHLQYIWADTHDLEKIPLMTGAKEALLFYRNRK